MVIIRRVWMVTKTKQKCITIPYDSDIMPGDYVKVEKVEANGN